MKMLEWRPEMIRYMQDASEHTEYNQTIAAQIMPYLKPDARICDAGCGLGYLSLELAPYVQTVTAADINPDALDSLQTVCRKRGIGNIRTQCGKIEEHPPVVPYDAMVFCFFGSIEEVLSITAQQCKGDVFVIVRNYPNHRFSVGQHPHQLGGYSHFCSVLEEKGIPYEKSELELEFGQPLRSLEDAKHFYCTYSNDLDKSLITDDFIQKQVVRTENKEFPYYLPHIRKIGFLHWTTAGISR